MTIDEISAMPKEEIRPYLVKIGDEMCDRDITVLADKLIENGCGIIDGIRRKKELNGIKNKYNPLVIWINRPDNDDISDNTEVTAEDADYVFVNRPEIADPELSDARLYLGLVTLLGDIIL